MQIAAPTDDETIAALEQMKRSIRMAFCGVMQSTRLPPMAAMSLAATAVGLLYLEVAACASRGRFVSLRLGASRRSRPRIAADFARARGEAASRRFPRSSGRW